MIRIHTINIFSYFRLKRKHIPLVCSFLIAVVVLSCNSEDANDCLQTDGSSISYTVDLPSFERIQMEDDMRVLLEEGPVQRVSIETGENLVSDLVIKVEQGTLVLQNNNGCNFLREYGRTLVKIISPNITFIRQASSFEIRSNGLLTYPELLIKSNTDPNSLGISNANKSGEVILNIDIDNFAIRANGSSNFKITGQSRAVTINFSDEFPQFDGRDLLVDDLTVAHTGAANMIVHPLNSITGVIRATGDVIAVNQPPIVDVEELFTGRLIFE